MLVQLVGRCLPGPPHAANKSRAPALRPPAGISPCRFTPTAHDQPPVDAPPSLAVHLSICVEGGTPWWHWLGFLVRQRSLCRAPCRYDNNIVDVGQLLCRKHMGLYPPVVAAPTCTDNRARLPPFLPETGRRTSLLAFVAERGGHRHDALRF